MSAAAAPPAVLPRISDYLDFYARRQPDAEAWLSRSESYTYEEAAKLVAQLRDGLLRAGLGSGDRVGVFGHSSPTAFALFLAVAGVGAVYVGLNPKYSIGELEYVIRDSSPTLLVGVAGEEPRQEETLRELARRVNSVRHVVSGGQTITDDPFFAPDPGSFALIDARRAEVEDDWPAAIVYTSGTTGRPKGAMLPHRGFVLCSVIQGEHWNDGVPPRVPTALPINHVGWLGDTCAANLVAGGALYFMEKFSAEETLSAIEQHGLTHLGGIPTMLIICTQAPAWDTRDLSSVTRVIWGGAAASRELLRALAAKLPHAVLCTSYGMTETVGSVVYTADDDSLDILAATVGRPDPRYEVRLAAADGRVCEVGEEGEILVKGDFVMLGYLNQPEATGRAIDDEGWLHTGDIATIDLDGRIRLVGRSTDMFKSGGYNVYPREVEIALETHPSVSLAAVIGVPDDLYGEIGVAWVVGSGVSERELSAHLRSRLANYKIPKLLRIVDELPILAIGKVDKHALRASLTD